MKKAFKIVGLLVLVTVILVSCDFFQKDSPISDSHIHVFDATTRQCSCGVIEDGIVAYIGESYAKATARFVTLQEGVNYLANQQKNAAKGNSKNTIHGYKTEIYCEGITIEDVEVAFDFSKSTVKFTGTQGIVVKGKNSKVGISGKKLESAESVATLIKVENGSFTADIDFKGTIEASGAELVISGGNVEITGFVNNSANANKIKLTSPSIILSLPLEEVKKFAEQIESGSTSKPIVAEHKHNYVIDPDSHKGPTNEEDGYDVYVCQECSMSYVKPIPKLQRNVPVTTIKVLNFVDSESFEDEIANVWDKFAELHPEIDVVREDLPDLPDNLFQEKLAAYVAQGKLPDVIYTWPSGRSETLHTEKLLYDLTELLERDGLKDAYSEVCVATQVGGYLGELPNGLTATSLMYVNKEVLNQYSLSVPTTYEELKNCAQVLAKNGVECVAMDCADGWVMQSCLFSLICGRFGGADWYDKLAAGKINFTDEWFVKALTTVENLYQDGIISKDTLSRSYQTVSAGNFANGKAAFFIDGDWSVSNLQENYIVDETRQADSFEMINFPALPDEVVQDSNSAIVNVGWAISKDTAKDPEKLEAAWTLVKFLEGEEVQTWRLLTGASFPSLKTVDVDKVCDEYNLQPFVAKRAKWYQSIKVATPVIDGVLPPVVYEVINTVLAKIGHGETTVNQGVADVQAAWTAYNQ